MIILTEEQLDNLIWMIANGKNTYKELHKKFPELTNVDIYKMSVVCSYYGDIHKLIYLNRKINIDDYPKYELFDDDTFRLSEEGINRLYVLKKEFKSECKANEAIRWAKYATILTFIGLIYQFIENEKSSILYLLKLIFELMQQAF